MNLPEPDTVWLRFSPCGERAITRPCEGRIPGAIPGRGTTFGVRRQKLVNRASNAEWCRCKSGRTYHFAVGGGGQQADRRAAGAGRSPERVSASQSRREVHFLRVADGARSAEMA